MKHLPAAVYLDFINCIVIGNYFTILQYLHYAVCTACINLQATALIFYLSSSFVCLIFTISLTLRPEFFVKIKVKYLLYG